MALPCRLRAASNCFSNVSPDRNTVSNFFYETFGLLSKFLSKFLLSFPLRLTGVIGTYHISFAFAHFEDSLRFWLL